MKFSLILIAVLSFANFAQAAGATNDPLGTCPCTNGHLDAVASTENSSPAAAKPGITPVTATGATDNGPTTP